MVAPVAIAGRLVGDGNPCFIIAEAGVNHNGDLGLARELVRAASAAGADAVKFQTWRTELIVTDWAPAAAYQKEAATPERTQFELLKALELDREAHRELQELAASSGVYFLSTPDEEDSAAFLAALGVPAFKIGSAELTNLPYLEYVAGFGRPVLLSTGMGTLTEVAAAVDSLNRGGAPPLVLLHCTSVYPANPQDCNLRAISTLQTTFERPVGYSDHTPGYSVALAAVALGANVIEKHLTLDRRLPGPDHAASLEPDEFRCLVDEVRGVEQALGSAEKAPVPAELEMRAVVRKSLVAAADIPRGARLGPEHVARKRPGSGLSPADLSRVLGRVARIDIPRNSLLRLEDLA